MNFLRICAGIKAEGPVAHTACGSVQKLNNFPMRKRKGAQAIKIKTRHHNQGVLFSFIFEFVLDFVWRPIVS